MECITFCVNKDVAEKWLTFNFLYTVRIEVANECSDPVCQEKCVGCFFLAAKAMNNSVKLM